MRLCNRKKYRKILYIIHVSYDNEHYLLVKFHFLILDFIVTVEVFITQDTDIYLEIF